MRDRHLAAMIAMVGMLAALALQDGSASPRRASGDTQWDMLEEDEVKEIINEPIRVCHNVPTCDG